MNKKQKFILAVGCVLLFIHLLLYFGNVQEKYKKLQSAKVNSEPIKEKEDSFKRVILAWVAVSLFLGFSTGILMRLSKSRLSSRES